MICLQVYKENVYNQYLKKDWNAFPSNTIVSNKWRNLEFENGEGRHEPKLYTNDPLIPTMLSLDDN